MQIFCSEKRAPLAQPPPPALAVVQAWFNRGSAVQPRPFRAQPGLRFGIGFKKNNQFFPIVFQNITDCSDYGPFK